MREDWIQVRLHWPKAEKHGVIELRISHIPRVGEFLELVQVTQVERVVVLKVCWRHHIFVHGRSPIVQVELRVETVARGELDHPYDQ